MLDDAIKRLEDTIRRLEASDAGKRGELLKALGALKGELGRLAEADADKARSLAGFVDAAAHEATRPDKPEGLLDHTLKAVAMSARGFEASHPRLVELVDRLSTMLARLGI